MRPFTRWILPAFAAVVVAWSAVDYVSRAGPGAAKKARIAIVLSVGGLGDKSFNDSAYEGMARAERDLGIEEAHAEPTDIAEDPAYLRLFAQEKFDLVIGTGFLMSDSVARVAKEFPQTRFAIIDSVVDLPNVASLIFAEHEGSYLVGALAGLKTKTNTVGFVGGMDIPLIHKFEVGYCEGVKAVRPDCKVLMAYTGTGVDAFHDPVKGKALTEALIGQGADVIFHAAGATGNGVIKAAEERKVFAIGVDSNQNWMAPGRVLTSMEKRVDVAVYKAIQSVLDGKFKPGIHVFGLKEEGVGYSLDQHNKALIDKPMLDRVEALRKEIIDGKIKVTNYQDKH